MNELLNRKNKMNGLDLLDLLDKESIKVTFFDPQYRGVLDKLSYWVTKATDFSYY